MASSSPLSFVVALLLLVTNNAKGLATQERMSLGGLRRRTSKVAAQAEQQAIELATQPSGAECQVRLSEARSRGVLPRFDALDATIVKLALPAVANFVILPLVGTVDTFFVGRLGDERALAALGAANQVFSSVFFVVSFLPSVVTPLVAAANAAGDEEKLRERVGEAAWVSAVIGGVASIALALRPGDALALVLPASASAATRDLAVEYLGTRALALAPAMLAFVGFATFRGLLDVVTPLRVSFVTQSLNVILDPILIFALDMGVKGAALATAASEVSAAFFYAILLSRRGIVRWTSRRFWANPPSLVSLAPLLLNGAGVLSRSLAMNAAFLAVTRATQAIDASGAAAAAHTIAMQTWQLGGVVLFALSAVSSILVPAKLNAPLASGGGSVAAKRAADRMLGWGASAGILLAALQLAALPLLNLFTPVEAVRDAARAPAIIGAVLQIMNGLTFVGEGIMQGHSAFFRLALNSAVASAAMVASIHKFGTTLVGIWLSFGVFNIIRLVGAMHHHLLSGPLARSKLKDLDDPYYVCPPS
ncbi:hypothetical protein CTAYLR_010682 [Chrysophaeum taylorii]|uniref:Multidrug and toxic compound extrusion protein n=1 Tax=Chrysophaeum taylorii TaxID=2483200 RepID=A0AAD7XII3_9STRA|nr:hypothetical protein CTAYLR_010682 [Chrysophaeum taylorii]